MSFIIEILVERNMLRKTFMFFVENLKKVSYINVFLIKISDQWSILIPRKICFRNTNGYILIFISIPIRLTNGILFKSKTGTSTFSDLLFNKIFLLRKSQSYFYCRIFLTLHVFFKRNFWFLFFKYVRSYNFYFEL